MQHEQRIAAQEARGVDAKGDIGADAFRTIGGDNLVGGAIAPLAFHGARCCRDAPPLQALPGLASGPTRWRVWTPSASASAPGGGRLSGIRRRPRPQARAPASPRTCPTPR